MSDIMTSIPFGNLMDWVMKEHQQGAVFGVRRPFIADMDRSYEIFGRKLETPFGPAAGPHTQLAQNIAAAYAAGGRFFELKTVQKLDGKQITVAKPCITAEDECYNVEWSTELTVPQAFEEYVKAWFLLYFMAKEYGYGAVDGFQFNMSVGYDLEGIKTPKIDRFIEQMKNASDTPVFIACKRWLKKHLSRFRNLTECDVDAIPAQICNSVTVSTMHGCPPEEIERIAMYLLAEKKLHTFVKCNPTLLGYDFVRKLMNETGYTHLVFSDAHFKDDLQYTDAVPMLRRLRQAGIDAGLSFGVKLTNTFPVDIKAGELPGEEMYMSGKPLFFLSMHVARKLSEDFHGTLRISYSGGADAFTIHDIVDMGIWPVTVATTLLKPGGYERLSQMGRIFADQPAESFTGVNAEKAVLLIEKIKHKAFYKKLPKARKNRKNTKALPLTDCFMAPCEEGCPIHQDITAYMQLVEQGHYAAALRVILKKNPLPFITGTICYHMCMNQCTRRFYETPVNIRKNKLLAAQKGYKEVMDAPPQAAAATGKTAVVVGGGPAGLSAAYFLSLGGVKTTVMEKAAQMGGIVRSYLCDVKKQITADVIDKDVRLIEAAGVHLVNNVAITDLEVLQTGYDYIVLAVGAADAGLAKRLGSDAAPVVKAGQFYRQAGLAVDEKNRVQLDEQTAATSRSRIYAVGDGTRGISSVVECIRDSRKVADAILGSAAADTFIMADRRAVYSRRGILTEETAAACDRRCLNCDSYCENCVEVCPNRANIVLTVPGLAAHQILHIDYMCNECGNCRTFCPWAGAPYLDKFTLFANEQDMADSRNQGFVVVDAAKGDCKVRLQGEYLEYIIGTGDDRIPEKLRHLMGLVVREYDYLLIR